MVPRRDFLKKSAALAAASAMPKLGYGSETSHQPPFNLLFITVDDMDWSLPGFMGNKHRLTPHLDALAARSHRFIHNRTTAAICQPSREAMMTGRVPHRSGGLGFDPIDEGVPTLVSVLQQHGYFTAGIHKLEHMQPPSCFPWDHAVPGKERRPSEYGDAVTASIRLAKEKKQPFFINCNLNDPHRPFYSSAEAVAEDHSEQGDYHVAREIGPDQVEVPTCLEDLPDVRKELAQYWNSAQRMDVSIGRVLAALKDSGEEAATIVFFSADHGMPFPFSKATCYDHGTRTPALLHYPGMGAPRQYEDRTMNIDYMPTLLEIVGVRAPAGMDGQSWVPLLNGHKQGREFQLTHVNDVVTGAMYPMRALQDDRYSLCFTPWADGKLRLRLESMMGLSYPAMAATAKVSPAMETRVEQYTLGVPLALYDLRTDPGQRVNIMHQPEQSARFERMKLELRAQMASTGDPQLENFDRLLHGDPTVVKQPAELRHVRE